MKAIITIEDNNKGTATIGMEFFGISKTEDTEAGRVVTLILEAINQGGEVIGTPTVKFNPPQS